MHSLLRSVGGGLRRRGIVAVIGAAAIGATVFQAADAVAAPTQTSHFIQVATTSNSAGDYTVINNAAANGNPNAILFVTPNWDPGDVCNCVYDSKPIAVYYNGTKWAIFHEDGSAIPAGAAYNVLVVPGARSNVFQVTAGSSNTAGDTAYINNATTNGKPTANLQVTQVWNAPGASSVYNNHPVGVWYTGSGWAIFQEDTAAMTQGASFNVLVGTPNTGGGKVAVRHGNTVSGDFSYENSAVTNGDPNAFVLATPDWNPHGGAAYYDAHTVGVWYDGNSDKIAVFHEDGSAISTKSSYNLLMFNS